MRFSLIDDIKNRPRTYAILGIVMVSAVLLILLISGVPLSTNPTFCGKMCHATNAEYQSWQRSSHGEVACHFCHMDRSYVGLYAERFVKPVERLLFVLNDNYEKPLNADSDVSRDMDKKHCLRCHSPDTREFTGARGLNVTSKMHNKHLDAGLQCTSCHNRIAHIGAEKYEPLKTVAGDFKYKNFMTMREGCWRCHTDDDKYRDEKALALVGDKVAPTACDVCHNPKWELKPVTGEYNHNDVAGLPWKDGKLRHGKIAKADFGACMACHQKKAGEKTGNKLPNCTSTCHNGVTMPHNSPQWARYFKEDTSTPLWLQAHAYVADELKAVSTSDSESACSMCHNKDGVSADFCQKCHHQEFDEENNQPNAPWKNQHFKVVTEIGSSACQKCHLLEFCAFCHTNGEKPARGLFLNRRQQSVPISEEALGEMGSE